MELAFFTLSKMTRGPETPVSSIFHPRFARVLFRRQRLEFAPWRNRFRREKKMLPFSLSSRLQTSALSILSLVVFPSEKKQNPRSKDGGEGKKTRHRQSARMKRSSRFVCCGANSRERERERNLFFFLQKKRRRLDVCLGFLDSWGLKNVERK